MGSSYFSLHTDIHFCLVWREDSVGLAGVDMQLAQFHSKKLALFISMGTAILHLEAKFLEEYQLLIVPS